MAKLILFFTIFIVSGCSFLCDTLCEECEPITDIQYQEVIVEKAVTADIPDFENTAEMELPVYLLSNISEDDPEHDKKIAEAYHQTIIILMGEVNKRDNTLDEIRNFKIEDSETTK